MSSIILSIDTSTKTVGLALYDGVMVLSEMIWTTRDHHTVELAPAVADILAKSGLQVSALSAVGLSLGPGSFTGLRIGMGLAKGLCLARHLPLVGIPTLDALAASQPLRDIPMTAVLQAGRGRLAVGRYQAEEYAWVPVGDIEVLTPRELLGRVRKTTYICGELSQTDRRILSRKHKKVILASPAQSLRRPGFLAELGWRRWQSGAVDDPASLSPIYIHRNEPIPG